MKAWEFREQIMMGHTFRTQRQTAWFLTSETAHAVQVFLEILKFLSLPLRGQRHLLKNLTKTIGENDNDNVYPDKRCLGSVSLEAETETWFWCMIFGGKVFRGNKNNREREEQSKMWLHVKSSLLLMHKLHSKIGLPSGNRLGFRTFCNPMCISPWLQGAGRV